MNQTKHISVMKDEVLDCIGKALSVVGGRNPQVLDCTLGGGGHAEALLDKFENLKVVGLDCDLLALERCRNRLVSFGDRLTFIHGDFANAKDLLISQGVLNVEDLLSTDRLFDGILLDLGISSDQLDDPRRGFSFQHDGPLDMRMDSTSPQANAETIVNTYNFGHLVHVFSRGGLPRDARKMARAIVNNRPIRSTGQLANICQNTLQIEQYKRREKGRSSRHPATVVFQALRIEVNDEFGRIETLLKSVLELLNPGGRLVVISFHSLEDKLFTKTMRLWQNEDRPIRGIPLAFFDQTSRGRLLTPKAILPSEEEASSNPRARSARIRVFEKSRFGKLTEQYATPSS